MASGDLMTADSVKGDTYHFHIHTKEASVQLGEQNKIVCQTPPEVIKTIKALKKRVQDLTKSELSTKLNLSLMKRKIDRVEMDVTVNRNAKRPKKNTGEEWDGVDDGDCSNYSNDEWEAGDGDCDYSNDEDDDEDSNFGPDLNGDCSNYSNDEWEAGDGECYYSSDEGDDEDSNFVPDLNDIGEYDYDELNGDDGGDDDDDDDEETVGHDFDDDVSE